MDILKYAVKRILIALLTLFIVTAITFFLMNLIPGDPFMSEKATEASRAALRAKYGLDRPIIIQYLLYMKNLLHGDMGISYVLQKNRAISDIVFTSFAVSLRLGAWALLAAIAIGIPLGCLAGLKKDGPVDGILRVFTALGISVPGFVIASVLMIIFAVRLGLLPTTGLSTPAGYVMPVITLALYPTCYLARLTRASILEVTNQDFLRTVKAKGMSERTVIFVHALKNSLIPIITYLGPLSAAILTGGFVAESVFNIPGLGRYFVSAIGSRDYTLIMATTIFYSALIILMNMVCDILYKVVDPRIRLE